MFDPYRAWAAMIEILEDKYNAKITWTLTDKDGNLVTGPITEKKGDQT